MTLDNRKRVCSHLFRFPLRNSPIRDMDLMARQVTADVKVLQIDEVSDAGPVLALSLCSGQHTDPR